MSIEPVQSSDSRPPISPQMALRVAALGTIGLVMFGIIFFRLWYLQILTGNRYVHLVSRQQTRPLTIAAPRGEILARNGQVLVGNRTASAVQIVPNELPAGIEAQLERFKEAQLRAAKRSEAANRRLKRYERRYMAQKHPPKHLPAKVHSELALLKRRAEASPKIPLAPLQRSDVRLRALFARLGQVLHLPAKTIDERLIQGLSTTSYAPVTIDASASAAARLTIAERKREFPGVIQRPVSVRYYPYGEFAAQVFGHVGPVNGEELKEGPYKGLPEDTIVGQNGLEYYYDKYLEGTPGEEKILVNANNEPVPSHIPPIEPQAGYSLKTTIDLGLQKAGEEAMREQIAVANAVGKPADGAAFVAIDPLNGEIYAMGSYPSYNPAVFTRPISFAEYDRLVPPGEKPPASGGQPLVDRAAESGYPVGSTFKPIIAIGGLEAGIFNPYENFGGGACLVVAGEEFCNAESGYIGATDLVHALEVSSDTYFYTVGKWAYEHGGTPLQHMAERLGIGRKTGIDLPKELNGVVPDEKWVQELDREEERCTREVGHSCEIVAEPHMLWTVGQSMQLATGQGSLVTSPLQMAVAYSALVNAYRDGGEARVVTPHLGMQIDESNGELVQSLDSGFKIRRRFDLNTTYLDLIFEGIHDAATGPGGTSTSVWQGWNESQYPVYGKTGTAERFGQETQSWYMCYVGNEAHPLVIAATVEQGGYGVEAAAPIARAIAGSFYHQSSGATAKGG